MILLHPGKPPAFSMHLSSCPAGFRRLQVQSRAPFSANFAMMAFSRVEHSSQTSIYAAPLLCWLLSFLVSKETRPRFWLHASHLWSVLSCLSCLSLCTLDKVGELHGNDGSLHHSSSSPLHYASSIAHTRCNVHGSSDSRRRAAAASSLASHSYTPQGLNQ